MGRAVTVIVAYALPRQQFMVEIHFQEGLTVRDAIESSGLLIRFPEIDLSRAAVGIFGRLVGLDTLLKPHDRVEIYRPLTRDPKEQRRLRAKAAKTG